MKNFQQTPKQRRVKLAKAKTAFQNSRNQGFQPRAAWENKRTVGGVAAGVLLDKQFMGALKGGVVGPESRNSLMYGHYF